MLLDLGRTVWHGASSLVFVLATISLVMPGRSAANSVWPLGVWQQPAQTNAQAQLDLVFTGWSKSCLRHEEANVNLGCLVAKKGRGPSGRTVVAAVLIQPAGQAKNILRITLPLEMQLPQGTRIIVDQGQPINAPYIVCITTGCIADYEASGELIEKLKQGQSLAIEGVDSRDKVVRVILPLSDFSKVYNDPAAN